MQVAAAIEPSASEDPIESLVRRLARPHSSGGAVIERAAILAEGSDFAAILAWIADNAGKPEEAASGAPSSGLHGGRVGEASTTTARTPLRYVLPSGVL